MSLHDHEKWYCGFKMEVLDLLPLQDLRSSSSGSLLPCFQPSKRVKPVSVYGLSGGWKMPSTAVRPYFPVEKVHTFFGQNPLSMYPFHYLHLEHRIFFIFRNCSSSVRR